MNLFYIAILTSFFTFGLHLITREDGFLSFIGRFMLDRDDEVHAEMLNPLLECHSCMSSFWTVVAFFYFGQMSLYAFVMFLILYFNIVLLDMNIEYFEVSKAFYLVLILCMAMQCSNPFNFLIVMFATFGISSVIEQFYIYLKRGNTMP